MKYSVANRIISLLPLKREHAKTAKAIGQLYYGLSEEADESLSTAQIRTIQRYLLILSEGQGGEPDLPASVSPVERVDDSGEYRYYKKLSDLALWQMSSETALNLLLAQNLVSAPLRQSADLSANGMVDVALEVTAASPQLKRLRDRIRLVNDGFGRQPATIRPEVLHQVLYAIKHQYQVVFSYKNSQNYATQRQASIQGLVAKDGSLYMLCTESFADRPRHFALHRVLELNVNPKAPALIQSGFDLDSYIEATNQLSHQIGEQGRIELELRVAPETIYHFKERPLTADQVITEPQGDDPWFRVQANLPVTMLLVPWLLSMGGWIEVVGPASVRDEMKARLSKALAQYG